MIYNLRLFFKKHWKSTFTVVAVFIISFINPPEIREIPGFDIGWDKIVHILMFFGISMILMLELFMHYSTKPDLRFWLLCAVLPACLGGLVEILQGMLTATRSCDFDDFVADVLGILIALLLVKTLKIFISKNKWLTKI